MYADNDDEPRSSFTTYLAEGDKLILNGEYAKSLESYTTALMLKPGDKNTLVARSKCYLYMGDPQSALKDADECLRDDKNYHKGLNQRAEALYQMGNFEHALMYFHRGHMIRPELAQFRLGIQKCQEAIENSVGTPQTISLDTSVAVETTRKSLDFRQKRHHKEEEKRVASEKTAKVLLGELYVDREYLEALHTDESLIKGETGTGESIKDLIDEGIKYLDKRTDFWRQQKPMYTRKKEKSMLRPRTIDSVTQELKLGNSAYDEEDFDIALGHVVEASNIIETFPDCRKGQHTYVMQADIDSLYGKTLLELGRIDEAVIRHRQEIRAAKRSKVADLKIRGMDNLAEAYIKQRNYERAIKIYNDRICSASNQSEKAWINHNWGRCLLEQGKCNEAEEKGLAAYYAAQSADDEQWQLNSKVLIGQAQLKSGNQMDAKKSFEEALVLAEATDDEEGHAAISAALAEFGPTLDYRMSVGQRGAAAGEESEGGQEEQSDDNDHKMDDDGTPRSVKISENNEQSENMETNE